MKPTNHSKGSGKCGKVRCSDCRFRSKNGNGSDVRLVIGDVASGGYAIMAWNEFWTSSSGPENLKPVDELNDVVGSGRELDGGDEFQIEEGE